MDDLSAAPQGAAAKPASFPGSQEQVGAARPAFNMEHRQWP